MGQLAQGPVVVTGTRKKSLQFRLARASKQPDRTFFSFFATWTSIKKKPSRTIDIPPSEDSYLPSWLRETLPARVAEDMCSSSPLALASHTYTPTLACTGSAEVRASTRLRPRWNLLCRSVGCTVHRGAIGFEPRLARGIGGTRPDASPLSRASPTLFVI